VDLAARVEGVLRTLGVRPGERLGVACSGGSDSVALVHLMTSIGARPVLLHVDHRSRPNSGDDADFVRELATSLHLECRNVAVSIDRAPRASWEAEAREARYRALRELGDDLDRIATGHTMDDQAETVLLRMTRGGSLAGIAPARERFIRPLLGIRRAELREWLVERGLAWRDDPTNADERFERNWVRASVLPLLEGRRPGVAKVLARIARDARDDEEALDALAAAVLAGAETDGSGVFIPARVLNPVPRAIRRRVIRDALRACGTDPSRTELDAVVGLSRGSARCGAADVWKWEDGVAVVRVPLPVPAPMTLPAEGIVDASEWGMRLRIGPASTEPWMWRSTLPSIGSLIRPRNAGDRVRTSAGSRKVQDVLVDAKVPRPLRDLVPVVATGDGAVAVVGLTSTRDAGRVVVDAQPSDPSWSRRFPWKSARA
jgi:tRNA(Ile)-lysidine synthase